MYACCVCVYACVRAFVVCLCVCARACVRAFVCMYVRARARVCVCVRAFACEVGVFSWREGRRGSRCWARNIPYIPYIYYMPRYL